MTCYVYIIGSARGGDRRSYVGWTIDLEARLARHNAGTGAKSTRGRVWVLLYAERHKTRGAAMSREWHLKRDRAFRRTILTALERRAQKCVRFCAKAPRQSKNESKIPIPP